MAMPKPSNTKARAQRDLWIMATSAGWQPPIDVNPRTIARWRNGEMFIPYRRLCEMVDAARAAGYVVNDAEYFAKPRLIEESTHG